MEGKSAAEVIRGAGLVADDVIAALEYLLGLPYVDKERVAVGGVSLGGLVSVMAVPREPRFKALISMALTTRVWTRRGRCAYPRRGPGVTFRERTSSRREGSDDEHTALRPEGVSPCRDHSREFGYST